MQKKVRFDKKVQVLSDSSHRFNVIELRRQKMRLVELLLSSDAQADGEESKTHRTKM